MPRIAETELLARKESPLLREAMEELPKPVRITFVALAEARPC